MSCPNLRTIYAFLEDDLSAAELRNVQEHLAGCSSCRTAAEERRAFLKAAATLPPLAVPNDFASSVMSRLGAAPARVGVLGWLAAALAGLASFAATLAVAALLTGHSLSGLFLGFNRFLLDNIRTLSSLAAKAAKYLYLAGKILVQVLRQLLEGFKILTSFIGPEAQIAAALAAVAILVGAGLVLRRNYLLEKTHDE
jgi:hypothetical protein